MTVLLKRGSAAVHRLIPTLDPQSAEFRVAVIMIAATMVGPNEEALAIALGYEREFVAVIGRRLRAAHIWLGEGLNTRRVEGWQRCNALQIDLLVILGHLSSNNDPLDPSYRLAMNSPAAQKWRRPSPVLR
jgi:hypothetical protein